MSVETMSQQSTVFQMRMHPQEKQEMFALFEAMGLKPSQAIKMFVSEVKRTGQMPFTPSVPNKETAQTMDRVMQGKELNICKNADDLFDKLGI